MYNWKKKKVLVTGAAGFIGSHLTEKLISLGSDVRVLVRYNSRNDWGFIEEFYDKVSDKLEVVTGDIRDKKICEDLVKGVNVIFHLSSLIAIPYSYRAPESYVDTNIMGAMNIFNAALYSKDIEKIVHTSTSETYGTAKYVPIDEKHPLQGQSPYSASKIAADKLAESYYCSFVLPIATLRPFNTFGPRQSARAVIPTIISQALSGKDVELGALDPVRDLTFVKDTVMGFIKIAETAESVGEVVNIGNGSGITIGDLAQKIIDLIDKDLKILYNSERVRPDKSEVMKLICNNEKAEKLIGWSPSFTLDEGLKETITWIRANKKLFKTSIYNT